VRAEPAPDDATLSSLMAGPIQLVALDNRREFLEVSELTPAPGAPLHFLADGLEFVPFFEGTTHPFHSYVRTAATS
jgi:hypothetical protein